LLVRLILVIRAEVIRDGLRDPTKFNPRRMGSLWTLISFSMPEMRTTACRRVLSFVASTASEFACRMPFGPRPVSSGHRGGGNGGTKGAPWPSLPVACVDPGAFRHQRNASTCGAPGRKRGSRHVAAVLRRRWRAQGPRRATAAAGTRRACRRALCCQACRSPRVSAASANAPNGGAWPRTRFAQRRARTARMRRLRPAPQPGAHTAPPGHRGRATGGRRGHPREQRRSTALRR